MNSVHETPQIGETAMLGTFRTLIAGANARAEETVRDIYSIELIDQKIREATSSLNQRSRPCHRDDGERIAGAA